jgi:hypothetical protein
VAAKPPENLNGMWEIVNGKTGKSNRTLKGDLVRSLPETMWEQIRKSSEHLPLGRGGG